MREVVDGPLVEIAPRLSRFLADGWPHRALVIFTRECTGRPRKVAGDQDIVDRITLAELDELKSEVEPGGAYAGAAVLTGTRLWVWAIRDPSDTLLVLFPRDQRGIPRPPELMAAFGLVATSIRQQVAQASPDYLAESRAASSARTRAIAELTASHEAVLAALLLTLRSPGLDDARARATATATASDALIALRSEQATDRALSEEAPAAAFERLRRELGPLLHHRHITADYSAPPLDGRPIPGEVAHGARAVTQSVVLAFAAQPQLDRLRIAWGCAAGALVIEIRDNAAGRLDSSSVRRGLEGRVRTLSAEVDVEVVADWGSRVTVRLPLDPPAAPPDLPGLAILNRREREVLSLVAAGMRNKAIATELGVAESTVKFHVAGLLKKLEVSSRGEAAAIGMQAGLIRRSGAVDAFRAR
ncbi:response regulator transcription factor [Nocardia sp. NPDC051750]|uniref:response regulator transcription factor n=1 Tax=Nocardia sp. NPDC051750 TaxID=3364325 RepID=UPI0037AD1FDE